MRHSRSTSSASVYPTAGLLSVFQSVRLRMAGKDTSKTGGRTPPPILTRSLHVLLELLSRPYLNRVYGRVTAWRRMKEFVRRYFFSDVPLSCSPSMRSMSFSTFPAPSQKLRLYTDLNSHRMRVSCSGV